MYDIWLEGHLSSVYECVEMAVVSQVSLSTGGGCGHSVWEGALHRQGHS